MVFSNKMPSRAQAWKGGGFSFWQHGFCCNEIGSQTEWGGPDVKSRFKDISIQIN